MNEILIIHILVNRDAIDSMPRFLIFQRKSIIKDIKIRKKKRKKRTLKRSLRIPKTILK